MRKKNEKQTSGSARYSMLFRSSLVTFSSLRSRLSESALFFRCRVFSLRLTWKKTPRRSSSSQSGYKRAKKVEVSCVCFKVTEIVTCFDLFTVKGKKRKAENMQEEEEKGPAPAEEEQAQTSQQAADDSDSDSDDSSDDEK